MTASLKNPIYTVYLVDGTTKYNLTPAIISLNLSDKDKQVAQTLTFEIVNRKTKEGPTICDILQPRQRVFVYANDGERSEEVFRGWIWTKLHTSELDSYTLTMKCYDSLIYLQESEDSLYFSKGSNTRSVLQSICSKWGIPLNYTYSTITHEKLVLKGTLTDIIMSDVLDKVKEKTGKKYVIGSRKDSMYVAPVGTNKTIYSITQKNNAIRTRYTQTMDGVVTKVVILGKADEETKKVPVVATVSGNTSKYGTLQKMQTKDEDTSLADAKKEARNTLNEKGKPTKEYEVEATDIPWIRKGDKVFIHAGHMENSYYIVTSIERDISNKAKKMTLTLTTP